MAMVQVTCRPSGWVSISCCKLHRGASSEPLYLGEACVDMCVCVDGGGDLRLVRIWWFLHWAMFKSWWQLVLITDMPAGHVNDTATGTRDCITNHQMKSLRQLTCRCWASSLWPTGAVSRVPVTMTDALPEIPLGWLTVTNSTEVSHSLCLHPSVGWSRFYILFFLVHVSICRVAISGIIGVNSAEHI